MIMLASRGILYTPFHGYVLRLWGMQSVDSKNMHRVMSKGTNIGLAPGGFEEATISTDKALRVFVKERKGFIKMALKYGYKVSPVLTLGEAQIYNTWDHLIKIRLFLNKFKIPSVVHWTKYGIVPDPHHDLYTVVGRPLQLPTIPNPTQEEIDHWHQAYMQDL
jgi:hypothetical protein